MSKRNYFAAGFFLLVLASIWLFRAVQGRSALAISPEQSEEVSLVNYQEMFRCQCDVGKKIVSSPQLGILMKSDLFKEDSNHEYWALSDPGSLMNEKVFLKYDPAVCGKINFEKGESVAIQGQVEVVDQYYFLTPNQGYLVYQGKKLCQR